MKYDADNDFLIKHLDLYIGMMKEAYMKALEYELKIEVHEFNHRVKHRTHVRLLHGFDFTKNHIRL